MNICIVATGHFLAYFDFICDITQIIKNWNHWLRGQNLPVSQSFERETKACVLGYMAGSCAALSRNFTMHDALKNLLPGATQNEYY